MKLALGFTIVELLVAVVISAVLFAGGMAAYKNIGVRKSVEQAGSSFQANLRLFQQKAVSGEKPLECNNETFVGYRVRYLDNSSYRAQPICSVTEGTGEEFNLPTGITFLTAFLPNSITFPVLGGEVSGAQTITLGQSGFNYQVIIEPSGVIRGGVE